MDSNVHGDTNLRPRIASTACSIGGEICQYLANLGYCGSFFEELFFAVDHCVDVGGGEFETMAVCNSICWASFHTIAAKNTSRVVDVVDAGITFAGGNSLCLGVFGGFDINAARRAGSGAQKAADALLQAIFVAMQDMDAAISRLEVNWFFGIIFRDGFPQHIAECHAETFNEGNECFASFSDYGRHRIECSKAIDAGQIGQVSGVWDSYARFWI
ncbi:MAG TPA: hypothetical protein VGI34_02885 [Candidatus Acidoferrales bacterium]